MGTTTKMFYIALQDKEFANILSIISDVYTNTVTEKTINKAKTIEHSFLEYWNENQWIRFIAGFNVENMEEKDVEWMKNEIKDEFEEAKEKEENKNDNN